MLGGLEPLQAPASAARASAVTVLSFTWIGGRSCVESIAISRGPHDFRMNVLAARWALNRATTPRNEPCRVRASPDGTSVARDGTICVVITRRTTVPVVGALVVAAVIGFLVGRTTASNDRSRSRNAALPTTSGPATTTAPTQGTPDLGAFAGEWYHHDFGMTIDHSGGGTFAWRTFADCGNDPPPCDDLAGHQISPGGYALFVLSPPTGTSVSGRVFESNQAKVVPMGLLNIRLDKPDDMVFVVFADGQHLAVCGPDAKAPAVGQC